MDDIFSISHKNSFSCEQADYLPNIRKSTWNKDLNIFNIPPSQHFNQSRFIDQGYGYLVPTRDMVAINARQTLLKHFIEDISTERKFYAEINRIQEMDTLLYSMLHKNFSLQTVPTPFESVSKAFQSYINSSKELLEGLNALSQKNPELNSTFSNISKQLSDLNLDQIVAACANGKFEYNIIEENPLVKTSNGNMHDDENKIRIYSTSNMHSFGKKIQVSNYSSIPAEFILREVCYNSLYDARTILSPLGALYLEAAYFDTRKKQNKPVCIPEISDSGEFSIIGAEPIIPIAEPVVNDLSYNSENAHIVLNGLHSSGKTVLLKTIVHYYYSAYQGLCVPAQEAKIPLINNIYHSITIKKSLSKSSLQSELYERAKMTKIAKKGDVIVIDEFLQHASQDAADVLEPIIMEDYKKTGATIIIVTHRGEGAGGEWNFYTPGYKRELGAIVPTHKFSKMRPTQEYKGILQEHARQLVDTVQSAPSKDNKFREPGINLEIEQKQISEWYTNLENSLE